MHIEPLIRIKPMAKRLVEGEGASFDTIYRWLLDQVKQGTIPSYSLGNVDHVRESEIEAFLISIKNNNNGEIK